MKYYVIINGNSSLDIQGLAIESLPNISKPLIRTTREEIDGRDGDIITKLGYSAYDKTLNIGLWGNYDINEVIAYFNEEGVITFSNEPDKYYKFSILNRIDFINQLEKFKKASITIHCQPFKYKEQEAKVIEEEEHTTSGTSFNLSDTLEAPLLMDLKGNTSQTGTPTPSTPIPVNVVSGDNEIEITGLNKQPPILVNNGTTITKSGCNITLNNDEYVFEATGTSMQYGDVTQRNSPYSLQYGYLIIVPESATKVYLKLTNDNFNKNYICFYDSNKNSLGFTQITNNLTIPSNTKYLNIRIGKSDSVSGTIYKTKVMVSFEESSTYEPYNGTTYNIDLPVENKLNKDGGFTNQGINNTGGIVSNNTNALFNGYIDVLPDTAYTLSTNTSISGLVIAEYNGTTFIKRTQIANSSSNTITTGSTTNKVRIVIAKDGSTTMTQEIIDSLLPQFELGTKPNSFTPYGTTPIELNKIGTYQDYIYKENDKWYLHKETWKTILGVNNVLFENRYSSSSSGKYYFGLSSTIDMVKPPNNTTLPVVLCDKLIKKTSTNLYNAIEGISLNDGVTRILVYADAISQMSLNDANAWLSSNNLIIYGALATPTNTEITYTPLIEQLNTLEEAQSKDGTTNINQVNNDLPFILDITYYTGDTSITITNDGNIYSKPLLELKGTGNINIYLNGIQVFVVSLNDEIIYIDTDKMEAYYQGTLKNRQVVGDYNNFKLQSGNNNIQVDGGYVEYLKITNYSRWV